MELPLPSRVALSIAAGIFLARPVANLLFSVVRPKPTKKPVKKTTKIMSKFTFPSGLPDCCASNPESYKVVAEIPNARLVEMRVPTGGEDIPHDHPVSRRTRRLN